MNKKIEDMALADENYQRYVDVKGRGHDDYIDIAKLNENFYMGGGRQWKPEDREYLTELERPVIEDNQIFPAVNTAKGMQVKSRVDISYKPSSNDATEETAHTLTQIAMQICDDINYQWLESQVYEDGLIQQRGYFDFRISFDDNMLGTISATALDPLDVLPDPNGNSYDPETWSDVIVTRWMTLDDIEQTYGKDKRDKVESYGFTTDTADADFDDRNSFGDSNNSQYSTSKATEETDKYLIIDRQHRRLVMTDIVVLSSGDIFPVSQVSENQLKAEIAKGAVVTKKMIKRIRWTVSTDTILMHDDWSPFKTLTVIPFYPYFRRGKTIGMVDNARSPQEFLNKNLSLYQYIVAGIANTGWTFEQDSLVNMDGDELAEFGSKSGVVVEYKKGAQPPKKIEPPKPPAGIERMIDRATQSVKTTTGISDDLRGLDGPSVSGISREIKNYQGANNIAGPMDNLGRTQYYVAKKILELIQGYYTENRVMMITNTSYAAPEKYEPVEINVPLDDGTFFNDLTMGTYDVVVSTKPITDTFRDNQWVQAKDLRDMGVFIPDEAMISMSNLAKKDELITAIADSKSQQVDPEAEAKVKEREANAVLKLAGADKAKAETVGILVDAKYSAVQTAGVITENQEITPMADILLRSSGDVDKDAPPLMPASPLGEGSMIDPTEPTEQDLAAQRLAMPPNYDPTTPVPVPQPDEQMPELTEELETEDPTTGVRNGIKTQRIE